MTNIDLIQLGSRLQNIETDIEGIKTAIKEAEDAPSKLDKLFEHASKIPKVGATVSLIGPYIVNPTSTIFLLAVACIIWILITLLGITSAVHWTHKNIFGTHEAISVEYNQQRELHVLGKNESTNSASLFDLVSRDIEDGLKTRRQLISSISSGAFIFSNAGGTPTWQEDSIPIYFSASADEAAWFYVRIDLPNDTLEFTNLGIPESMNVSEMFEIRGSPHEDQMENIHKINTFSEKGGFYEQRMADSSLVPSLGQPFHKFDLTISPAGKNFLERFVENQQVVYELYKDGYRLSADVMVVVRPK